MGDGKTAFSHRDDDTCRVGNRGDDNALVAFAVWMMGMVRVVDLEFEMAIFIWAFKEQTTLCVLARSREFVVAKILVFVCTVLGHKTIFSAIDDDDDGDIPYFYGSSSVTTG